MDLFCLKKKSAGVKLVTNFSHLIAGYSKSRATLFLKVNNERTRGNCKEAIREILTRCWQKNSTKKYSTETRSPMRVWNLHLWK